MTSLAVNPDARGRGGAPAEVRRLSDHRGHPAHAEKTARIGMAVFLASWAMMFIALFFAYGLVRLRAPVWPPPGELQLPRFLPGLNTLVIALSSATLGFAARAIRPRPRALGLGAAAGLGAVFLALQAVVWARVWRGGLLPSGGPYGSVFYALTTFHALHVLVGLVALGLLAARGGDSRASRLAVRLWAMYWHFVGAVWVAMYAAVYLA